eukprot:2861335-Amphidinium_carterae.2
MTVCTTLAKGAAASKERQRNGKQIELNPCFGRHRIFVFCAYKSQTKEVEARPMPPCSNLRWNRHSKPTA